MNTKRNPLLQKVTASLTRIGSRITEIAEIHVFYPSEDDKPLPTTPPFLGVERPLEFEYDEDKYAEEVMAVPDLSTITEHTEDESSTVASLRRNTYTTSRSSRLQLTGFWHHYSILW